MYGLFQSSRTLVEGKGYQQWPWALQVVIDGIQESASALYQQISEHLRNESKPSFYERVQRDEHTQRYRLYCDRLAQDKAELLQSLQTHPISPQALGDALVRHQQMHSKDIVSPLEYNRQLAQLEEQICQELEFPRAYGDSFREARYRFRERLQKDPENTLQCFNDDVLHRLTALSSHQLKLEELPEGLSYYQGLVPDIYYIAVQTHLEQFIELHRTVTQNPYEKTIESTAYEMLAKEINRCFEKRQPAPDHQETQKPSLTLRQFAQESHRALNQILKFIKKHPFLSLGMVGGHWVRGALGEEFQVNTYTTGDQGLSDPIFGYGPSPVVSLSGGNFAVVWQSDGQDGSGLGIYGQLFNNTANKLGTEFPINTYTTDNQLYPSIASLTNGNFIVAWTSVGQDSDSSWGIYGQLFDNIARRVGNEFQINTNEASTQAWATVSGLVNNNFVVVWQSVGRDGSGYAIVGQLFNGIAQKLGNDFLINTYAVDHQEAPSIVRLPNDNFIVTWSSITQTRFGQGVYGQLFNSTAGKLGAEFQVNTNNIGYQSNVVGPVLSAGLLDNNFVVIWQNNGTDGSLSGVYGQLFNSTAGKVGNEFQVNTYVPNDQAFSAVTNLLNGHFIVVWHSNGQDGSGYGVYGQLFNSTADKVGTEFQVNTWITDNQIYPSVARLLNNNIVVTWSSNGQDGSGSGVYGRILDPTTVLANPTGIIADSFFMTLEGSGDDRGVSIIEAADGYVTVGSTQSFGAGSWDVWMTKWNTNGTLLWAKTLGGVNNEVGNHIARTMDGGYITSGYTWSFGAGGADILLAKWNNDDTLTWGKTLGGSNIEDGFFVTQTRDGGYIVSGYTISFGAGNADLLLAKLNASGALTWSKTLGGTADDFGFSAVQTADSGYITIGTTRSFGAGLGDMLIAKWGSNGILSWAKTLGGTGEENVGSIIETVGGSYVVTGSTRSFGAGMSDVLLAKLDVNGTLIWAKTLGGANDDEGFSVIQAVDGGYIVSGNTASYGAGLLDVLLAKWDDNGDLNWAKILGGSGHDFITGYTYSAGRSTLLQRLDGSYVQVGQTESFGTGSYDLFLAKLDSNGNMHDCNRTRTITPSVNTIFPTVNAIIPFVQSWNLTLQTWSVSPRNISFVQNVVCESAFLTTGTTGNAALTTGFPGITSAATTANIVSTNNPSTLGTTSKVSASASSSSNSNQNIFIGVGVAAGTLTLILCIGGITYVFVKKRRNAEVQLRSSVQVRPSGEIELGESKVEAVASEKIETPLFQELSPKRGGKHTPIGDKYWLINEFNREEAKEFFEQTGIEIPFPSGDKKTKFTLDKGQFGQLKIAREIATGRFLAVKKVKGAKKIAASKSEAELHSKLNGKKNIVTLFAAVEMEDSKGQKALYLFMELGRFNGLYLSEQLALLEDISVKEKVLVDVVARGLLTALQGIHEGKDGEHIYHLDMKLTNFVLDHLYELRVIDFGCAVKSKTNLLTEGDGDSRYYWWKRLAVLRNQKPVMSDDKNETATYFEGDISDLWAVIITLSELLLNKYPFQETTIKHRIMYWTRGYFANNIKGISALQNPPVHSLEEFIKEMLEGMLRLGLGKNLTVAQILSHPIFQNKKYLFDSEEEKIQAFEKLKQLRRTSRNEKEEEKEVVIYQDELKARDQNYAHSLAQNAPVEEEASTAVVEQPHQYFTPFPPEEPRFSSNIYRTPAIKKTFFKPPQKMEAEQENQEEQQKPGTEETKPYQYYSGSKTAPGFGSTTS